MERLMLLFIGAILLSGCTSQEEEIKACIIDGIDTPEDVGVVLVLPNPIERREELVVCEAWINAHLGEKYGSRIPEKVIFSTCTDVDCKTISVKGMTR